MLMSGINSLYTLIDSALTNVIRLDAVGDERLAALLLEHHENDVVAQVTLLLHLLIASLHRQHRSHVVHEFVIVPRGEIRVRSRRVLARIETTSKTLPTL